MKRFLVLCTFLLFPSFVFFAQTPSPSPADTNTDIAKAIKQASAPAAVTADDMKATAKNPGAVFVRKDAPVTIPKFATAPTIDGLLNDEVWQGGALFGDFLQTQPGDNIKPSHPTEV